MNTYNPSPSLGRAAEGSFRALLVAPFRLLFLSCVTLLAALAVPVYGAVLAPPTISPNGGTLPAPQLISVQISAPAGVTIRYTTTGVDPNSSSPIYSSSIKVTSNTTIKAIATKSGYTNSAVAVAIFQILTPVAPPSFSPPEGTYYGSVTVRIAGSTPNAIIRYVTAGSPTIVSPQFTMPITLYSSATLSALAQKDGMLTSNPVTARYTIIGAPAAPATFSASDGTFADKVILTAAASNNATSYGWFRTAGTTFASATKIGESSSTTFNDTSAAVGTTYTYFVVASNPAGASPPSKADTGFRLVPPPSAPTAFSASKGTLPGSVALDWKPAADNDATLVYRGLTDAPADRVLLARVTGSSYSDSTGEAGRGYLYSVGGERKGVAAAISASDVGYRLRAITANQPVSLTNLAAKGAGQWFQLTVPKVGDFIFVTTGVSGDTVMTLYGPNSATTKISEDDDSGPALFSKIPASGFRTLTPGTYVISVRAKADVPAYVLTARNGSYQTAFTMGFNDAAGKPLGGDSFAVANSAGDFPTSSGVCNGMSCYSQWYFNSTAANKGPLFSHFTIADQKKIALQAQSDTQAILTVIGQNFLVAVNPPTAYATAENLIAKLQSDGGPQILVCYAASYVQKTSKWWGIGALTTLWANLPNGSAERHAVLVVGYTPAASGKGGTFQIYNNWNTKDPDYSTVSYDGSGPAATLGALADPRYADQAAKFVYYQNLTSSVFYNSGTFGKAYPAP